CSGVNSMCIASLGFDGLRIKGIGFSHVGTGNGQRTRNDPLLPIRISCRSYSRQSVRTGLLPANALSEYWYRQAFGLPHFRKISCSSQDNASLLDVKDRPCSALAADAITCPLRAGR